MNVILVRPDGIGDEILCLPVATALRRLRPASKITFLSSRAAAPVLEHHPALDEVLTVGGDEPFGKLIALFRGRFDAAVFLKPFCRLLAAAYVARVPARVATGYRWYSVLANRRVFEHRRRFDKHESEYNVGLLRGLGLEPGPPEPPVLALTEDERRRAGRTVERLPNPFVVVHPGGLSTRRWSGARYRALVSALTKEGLGVALTGSEAEREAWMSSGGPVETGSAALDLMGRLSVRELMAVIGSGRALVSGSTGPAHIAAALGVPTVSLFDPRRNQSPVRWRPLGRGAVLLPDVPTCERCIYEACPYWDCLDRITVEMVADRIRLAVQRPEPVQVRHV